ncbi:hypothetical protein [Microterricola viridarii]|uniref:Phage gp6-like head-tail connector protein n=1 Tax=Microterricola viridarii TaxID=412690 RepID=A0A0X8E2H4_9MICO|nr:hypothetical protein [Microterricola viridarii]AMB58242.1 hypothetical protein AWU67_04565 [Microterricola viridarii]
MAAEPTPAATDIAWYVDAIGKDAEFASTSQAEATELVSNFMGGASNPFGVPAVIVARAVLEVGADLFYRKTTRNGVVGFGDMEAQPFRLNRDPMAAAYPLLRPYLVIGL